MRIAQGPRGASNRGTAPRALHSVPELRRAPKPSRLRMLGHADVEPHRVPGRLAVELKKAPGLDHYIRVTAAWQEGELWARPLATQTSGVLRSAASATHLLHFPRTSSRLATGEKVELLPLSWSA